MAMTIPKPTRLALVAALALSAASGAVAREQVQIAGSSTVLPYATIVAEAFGENFPLPTPVVESGGSSAGLKRFCEGIGPQTIDIANSSRAMRDSEREECLANGVTGIVEVRIGYDGIVFASGIDGPAFAFTPEHWWRALASEVLIDGVLVANRYTMWNQIDPALPARAIQAFVPGTKHGTREVFEEKVILAGCEAAGALEPLIAAKGDEKAAKKACVALRTDGRSVDIDGDYTETLARIAANPHGIGVFGLSFYESNTSLLQAATMSGVTASTETIASGEYPVSRPLYFYLKTAHLGLIEGLGEFTAFFLDETIAGPSGPLAGYGLVSDPELAETRSRVAAAIAEALAEAPAKAGDAAGEAVKAIGSGPAPALALLGILAALGFGLGRSRARGFASRPHSLAAYHGLAVALASLGFGTAALVAGAVLAPDWPPLWRLAVVALMSLIGLGLGLGRITPEFRARPLVERAMLAALILAAGLAILTTAGIVLSMLFETRNFFAQYEWVRFFFNLTWSPQFRGDSELGILPLLWGTLYISLIALVFAVPVGLFAAIYMSEYASPRMRAVAKPAIEVLAGIPTIVYGLFALITVGPLLRDWFAQPLGFGTSSSSVMTAGLVMGVMLIPFVSSLSDDIINAVPQAMRDGSLGLGATQSETIRMVVIPAALPGIAGAVLLAASRAIGETMIVVLGAGAAAKLDMNPFEAMTTVTVKIVSQLTGDTDFNSPETLVAFALGLTLFVITLGLNVLALWIVRRYREQYE